MGGNREANTHDIAICDSTIHGMRLNDVDDPAKANVGLIRIDRGDWGGAYRIFIEGNELYDLAERGADWHDSESLHIAAITTLSCLPYISPDCGGTGALYIRNNHIHEVPSPFFFKNAAPGPIEITGNVVHDAQTLGHAASSNGVVTRNLIYSVGNGFNLGGGSNPSMAIAEHQGRNWTFRYNTFVGLGTVANVWHLGDHTFERNLFAGVRTSVDGAIWDTPGLIRKTVHPLYDDVYDADDPMESVLMTVTSNHNCVVATDEDYVHGKRFVASEVTGGSVRLEHYSLEEVRELFGWDQDSVRVVGDEPSAIFEDLDRGDYRVRSGHACESFGAYAE